MVIAVINGPNLNLVGRREPEIYGSRSLASYLQELEGDFLQDSFMFFQSNSEGELIDILHRIGYPEDGAPIVDGIIINPGAYAHYSYALADAIRSIPQPTVEVHISNIYAREEYRSRSVTAAACRGVITGFGLDGYRLAVEALKRF